jgi:uncharacterized BrkB/YihY/UPF0761 family membrane protein
VRVQAPDAGLLTYTKGFRSVFIASLAGIALLVWMYMVSLIILVGAEFNAMLFPRGTLGRELKEVSSSNVLGG